MGMGMAHLLPTQCFTWRNMWTVAVKEPPQTQRQRERHDHACIKLGSKIYGKKISGFSGFVVRCCTFSSSSASLISTAVEDGRWKDSEEQPLYLASQNGWKVRRLEEEDEDEIRTVAQIQAEAFHQPMPFFDHLFFHFFKAEVLAGLIYKLRNSPPNRYACLVAMDASSTKLVGVVDVTALRDEAVVQHLGGAHEYLYVSGLAVSQTFRRRKIGSCLLKACDVLSLLWGFNFVVLRAYEDDFGARKLYSNAGYRVVSGDPPWLTSWIGRRRRVIMIKQTEFLTQS